MIYNANAKKPKTPEQLIPLQLDNKRKLNAPKVDVARLKERMKAEQERLNQKLKPVNGI